MHHASLAEPPAVVASARIAIASKEAIASLPISVRRDGVLGLPGTGSVDWRRDLG